VSEQLRKPVKPVRPRNHCNRCGLNWTQRKPEDGKPRECPECHKRNWSDPPDEHPNPNQEAAPQARMSA
jgi:hypothetical protein